MNTASAFVIPHKPKERLRIRVGIHSGPAVGGIQKVGDSMPRYRMFGNALDVAYRINTLGKPMKIHISIDTKLLLDSIGGFHTEYRGLFEIKSKHQHRIDTYWLVGKERPETTIAPPSLETTEENRVQMVPDYVKDLMFPDDTMELSVKELGYVSP